MKDLSTNAIFEIRDAKITYGFKTAVQQLNLRLDAGQCLGLLGANGAGKTSTIKALLGMVRLKHGNIQVLGSKPGVTKVFSEIGFAPEDGVPADFLTGQEYLQFVARLKLRQSNVRKEQIAELLDWFELPPTKFIKEYSKGMKRRIVLAQALLGSPSLLILDEPLNGLDPLMIIKLRDRLDKFRKMGGTMLYSSHILSEIEKSCTHIAIMSNGELCYKEETGAAVRDHGSVEGAFAKFARNK